MQLDVPTLMAADAIATATSGTLLVAAWTQIRGERALAWWSSAAFIMTIALAILVVGLTAPNGPMVVAGSSLAVLSAALVWGGLRQFNRRGTPVSLLLVGSIATVAAGPLAAALGGDPRIAPAAVSFAAWVVLMLAAAFELWRIRAEGLWARWPLMLLFAAHAGVYVGGIVDALSGALAEGAPAPLNSWFGAIHFETIFYAMGTAVFMVLLCKERRESELKEAAGVDSLTGVANRGAFMEQAERRLARCHGESKPASLIVFDLDRFKSINDTFGHQVGDGVLSLFAEVALSGVRPNDFFGRHGGEEFAMILPGATVETGHAIAERIRTGFAEAASRMEPASLAATVSAGVASAPPESSLDDLLKAADTALYQAKNSGRNRVCVAEAGTSQNPDSNVIRVA